MLYEKFHALANIHDRGPIFLREDGSETRYSFSELIARARRVQGQLQTHGLVKGDRMGMIIPDNEQFILTFLGAVMGGIIPVPIYPPSVPGKTESYIWSSALVLEASQAKLVVAQRSVAPLLDRLQQQAACLESILVSEDLHSSTAAELEFAELEPEDTCFLQFTSGSTAAPKGVIVRHRNLAANAHAMLVHALSVDPKSDLGVSWLPLYHDMGLIGTVLAALLYEVPVVYIPTTCFIKNPKIWMSTVSRYRGTITFGPNFAFALATRRVDEKYVRELDLSCLRVVGCGAEPINMEVLRRFQATFAPARLDPDAIMPCYGMAEATLAITFHRKETPLRYEHIEDKACETERVAKSMSPFNGRAPAQVVSCGTSFPGHELAIVSPRGARLPEGRVGEIIFKGPSVTTGYYDNPRATHVAYKDGWLYTGDLGFLRDGELFVAGRLKDMIIINGRNYFAQDIEWAVEKVKGIRTGCVVAFGIGDAGTERLVVVAEAKHSASSEGLEHEVRETAISLLGIQLAEVVFVPPGTLPKTTSGKIQRQKTKMAYQQGTLRKSEVGESPTPRTALNSTQWHQGCRTTVCRQPLE